MLELDPKTTALVLIDLQKGHELKPYPADRVTKAGSTLADTFRKAGAPVVLVNVGFAKDFKDALRQPVDQPFAAPPGGFPENFSELIDGLAKPGDILFTKRQWGAFHGTELDLLSETLVVNETFSGVAPNMSVESAARQAWEYGYAVFLAEDATSGMSAEMHDFAIDNIFPRISRVVKSAELNLSRA